MPAMLTTSASLLKRLKERSEQDAWKRFVLLYTPLLCCWAGRLGAQNADADDLVQDVFTLLYQKLPEFTYRPQKSFRAWLRTVLVNKWREGRRRRPIPTCADPAAVLTLATPDPQVDFTEEEYRRFLVRRAFHLMQAEFTPTTWKACWETTVGDKAPAEVADELGISVRAVYLARIRVLQRLRQEMDGLLD
jgi:RNA polymerase sigma-70 factor (ECF subfamily)